MEPKIPSRLPMDEYEAEAHLEWVETNLHILRALREAHRATPGRPRTVLSSDDYVPIRPLCNVIANYVRAGTRRPIKVRLYDAAYVEWLNGMQFRVGDADFVCDFPNEPGVEDA